MFRALLTVALLAAPTAAVRGGDTPKGPPPQVMIARVHPNGTPFIGHVVKKVVTVEQEVQVKVKDRIETRKVPVAMEVLENREVALDGKDVQVFDGNGKRIAPGDVAKRIDKKAAVLVSADGKAVDRFYLRLLREGSLIVVSPALVSPLAPWGPVEAVPMKKMPKGE